MDFCINYKPTHLYLINKLYNTKKKEKTLHLSNLNKYIYLKGQRKEYLIYSFK